MLQQPEELPERCCAGCERVRQLRAWQVQQRRQIAGAELSQQGWDHRRPH